MKIVPLFIYGLLTIILIFLLNTTALLPAPLGKLLAPQSGLWQNAEPVNKDYSADLSFAGLKQNAEVYFDERMVPHVFAENATDAFFIQGFLHAKFRLWQMEFQIYAASGRVSELVGNRAIDFDREKRRLGMVYAAERSLKMMESDPQSLAVLDSYTSGVNAYIHTLTESTLPLEYKLMGYKPEEWTNLKSALFLKYMCYDLAGHENDFEYTNAKTAFSAADFDKLYPVIMDSLDPIVPTGTKYATAGLQFTIPSTADSLYFAKKDTTLVSSFQPDPDNGSNNWAVNGSKTKSGSPILCNDPHLGLNLPCIWFEMQITTPEFNIYGVSLPGTPALIIGFNDHCAFGFTNAMRDVRDYYEIKFRDDSRKEYWFENEWKAATFRKEILKIKGQSDLIDSVAYTHFGPVMYDKDFTGGRTPGDKYYAVRWKAHDPSNELKTFLLLEKAETYEDYLEAIKNMHTPGQNCIFANKQGDIAIWDQGEFPAKWKRQGDFVMPGTDSSYRWKGNIPQEENPHLLNPERGFVSSANQLPADSAYPYYLGGNFPPYRAMEINRRLDSMSNITPEDMMKLQTDNYNLFAETAMPLLLKNIDESALNADQKNYLQTLKQWNFRNEINSKAATMFVLVWDSLENKIWNDEFNQTGLQLMRPYESTLLNNLLKDSAFSFIDDINTPQIETLQHEVTNIFKNLTSKFKKLQDANRLEWGNYKDTRILHLSRLEPLSRLHLPIGGGTNCINATKTQHGPSWRMIVSLTSETEAWATYPGGQDGNPGSRYYDDNVNAWAKGEYNKLWIMKDSDKTDNRVKGMITFSKEN